MGANEWTVATKIESQGDAGHFGVQISVLLPRELTDKEICDMSRIADLVQSSLMRVSLRLDPKRQQENKEEREKIIGLFPEPIFVVEIPNGYCAQWCCKDRPWFLVTTPIGQVMIGWRKRVLSIDWRGSIVTKTADELFPDEDTTKSGRSIHAWGYDKAREYISVLLAQGVKPKEVQNADHD